jgi:hypothetical protein
MTVSTMPCWKRCLERSLVVLACVLFVGQAGQALAGAIEPQKAEFVADEQGLALNADFSIKLGPRLADAVERSVPLHFRFEFDLTRKRWYWADEHVTGRILNHKLSFQALTRQYRLTQGTQQQNFDSLDEALKVLGQVARLHVVDKTQLIPGETYRAAVRLSLDHEQLPKPLQVDALAHRDWRVEAKTLQWEFVPPLSTDK